jgi:hypothetical protein
MDKFKVHSDIHDLTTRNKFNLFQQTINLAVYQKGPEISAIQIYSHLPLEIRNLSSDAGTFGKALKKIFTPTTSQLYI